MDGSANMKVTQNIAGVAKEEAHKVMEWSDNLQTSIL